MKPPVVLPVKLGKYQDARSDLRFVIHDAELVTVVGVTSEPLANWIVDALNAAQVPFYNAEPVRECPGCAAAHAGIQGHADRHDDQCRADETHIAAAEAWERAAAVLSDSANYFKAESKATRVERAVEIATNATALANAATTAAEPNAIAFGATVEAVEMASTVKPLEAAAAHRRAAAAYSAAYGS